MERGSVVDAQIDYMEYEQSMYKFMGFFIPGVGIVSSPESIDLALRWKNQYVENYFTYDRKHFDEARKFLTEK